MASTEAFALKYAYFVISDHRWPIIYIVVGNGLKTEVSDYRDVQNRGNQPEMAWLAPSTSIVPLSPPLIRCFFSSLSPCRQRFETGSGKMAKKWFPDSSCSPGLTSGNRESALRIWSAGDLSNLGEPKHAILLNTNEDGAVEEESIVEPFRFLFRGFSPLLSPGTQSS